MADLHRRKFIQKGLRAMRQYQGYEGQVMPQRRQIHVESITRRNDISTRDSSIGFPAPAERAVLVRARMQVLRICLSKLSNLCKRQNRMYK